MPISKNLSLKGRLSGAKRMSRSVSCAAIIIGRNEGERLIRCIESVRPYFDCVVYVDSGSTDESIANAETRGALVAKLDPKLPFSAARARNEGLAALRSAGQVPEFVQFVDGDCELVSSWMSAAIQAFHADKKLAVVCGRRRERFPEASIFNRLCDIEWDTPIGEALACGGDSLARWSALDEVNGFNPAVIAGEEPEMCARLRTAGWRIQRLDEEMTRHDAAMKKWQQWWMRARRAGHAYTELAIRHGEKSPSIGKRPMLSALFWGLGWPLACLAASAMWGGIVGLFLALSGYGLLFFRVQRHTRRRQLPPSQACEYAIFIVLGKFAQTTGVLLFLFNRLRGRTPKIIEYKGDARPLK